VAELVGVELEPFGGRERKRKPAGEIPSVARDLRKILVELVGIEPTTSSLRTM